jgi:hypothetical protein
VTAWLGSRLLVWSHSIEITSIELLDPENIGVAVRILFLSHLQAEILENQGKLEKLLSSVVHFHNFFTKRCLNEY